MILTSFHSFLLNTKHGSTPIKLLVQIPKADQAEHMKDIAEVSKLEGKKEGKIEGIDLINALNIKLAELGRTEDIIKASQDSEYQKLLIRELVDEKYDD